jgi:hypothetical protein
MVPRRWSSLVSKLEICTADSWYVVDPFTGSSLFWKHASCHKHVHPGKQCWRK